MGPVEMGRGLPGWQLCSSEKGGCAVGKTKRGKGTKWVVLVDGKGIPWELGWKAPPRAKLNLRRPRSRKSASLDRKADCGKKPEHIIADRGYDSDPLRERFNKRGIDLIAPYRKNNKQLRYQDGHKIRRYKRRLIVERTNAGSVSFAACWFVMSICSSPTMPSFIWPASGLLSEDIFEIRSRNFPAPLRAAPVKLVAASCFASSELEVITLLNLEGETKWHRILHLAPT